MVTVAVTPTFNLWHKPRLGLFRCQSGVRAAQGTGANPGLPRCVRSLPQPTAVDQFRPDLLARRHSPTALRTHRILADSLASAINQRHLWDPAAPLPICGTTQSQSVKAASSVAAAGLRRD